MKRKSIAVMGVAVALAALAALATGVAMSAQDRYSVKVPGGLSFSEFKGYQTWQVISLSHNGDKLAVILGNPVMISALESGIPDNGKPFPDGAKMAKIHWIATTKTGYPGPPAVAGSLHDVDFMVKDGKRFADSGGWGYGAFEFDNATDTFRPGNTSDSPPQANDAKCGFGCHTIVKNRDYVFTEFPKR
ncbi:MAG TPA: cytochrome P460 family protein [Burkholderiales bacterium]|nr:cytochrome P460 family protein [Burkholderiales bacterium]